MKYLLVLMMLIPLFGFAQYTIETDRPCISNSPTIVPKYYLQLETGGLIERRSNYTDIYLPSLLLKYGVNDRLELRLSNSVQNITEQGVGLGTTGLGFKTSLLPERCWFPRVSFMGQINLPNWASEEYRAKYIAPQFRFLCVHHLSQKTNLGYNLGMEWLGFDAEHRWLGTLYVQQQWNTSLGTQLEMFNYYSRSLEWSYGFDMGFTYQFLRNHQLDFYGGAAVNDSYFFASVGYSYRFNVRQMRF